MSLQLANARRAELDALIEEHGGGVTPAQIVEFASNPNTYLHSLFTWDESEAARKYRESQAQSYLRAVVKLIPRPNGEALAVRAYVSLSPDRGSGFYRPVVDVLEHSDMRQQLLQDALAELKALRAKYGHLEELAQVWDAARLQLQAA